MGDSGGIFSLAGFSYQIKVFILQTLEVDKGCTLEYETIDDVALKMNDSDIDKYEDKLCSVLNVEKKKAIQVKRTKVTNCVAQKVVKNWILADENNKDIDEFVLVTDREVDENIFDSIDIDMILQDINMSSGCKSIEAKIKKLGYDEAKVKEKTKNIVKRSHIQKYEDIDKEIEKKFYDFFVRDGINQVTYFARIKEFLKQITVDILEAIGKGRPYLLKYEQLSHIRNSIIINFTDEKWEPSFSEFKRLNKISIEKMAAIKPREYEQLCTCVSLDSTDISRFLLYAEYFVNCKREYYERGMSNIVADIEYTAYDNFCDVKMELKKEKKDTPYDRLIRTKEKPNSKTLDDQMRYGVCIDLTSKDTDKEIQISWKDD